MDILWSLHVTYTHAPKLVFHSQEGSLVSSPPPTCCATSTARSIILLLLSWLGLSIKGDKYNTCNLPKARLSRIPLSVSDNWAAAPLRSEGYYLDTAREISRRTTEYSYHTKRWTKASGAKVWLIKVWITKKCRNPAKAKWHMLYTSYIHQNASSTPSHGTYSYLRVGASKMQY